MDNKRRRQENAETTRKALMATAERLFAENGYAATSIDEIVLQEQLTKGAVYYHFKDKKSLFESIVDKLIDDMANEVSAAVDTESDPWERTSVAIETYLEGCMNKAYRQIVIQEAPTVLGWTKWKEKERNSVAGLSVLLIKELMDAGCIGRQSVELLASIIFGAITEAAIGIASAEYPYEARDQARSILQRMIRSL